MSKPQKAIHFEREVSPLERMFIRSPYAIVTMVARIKGEVTGTMLAGAVSKVQQRHQNLRVRIVEDEHQVSWFSSEGVKAIPVEVVARESDTHWMEVYHQACKVPFEFDERPAIRFILIHSPDLSELMIFCHHVICDGMSLAYLARDLLVHLGDPVREVEVLPDPPPMGQDNLPDDVSLNAVARLFINRINKKWDEQKVFFDQEDYRNIHQVYWANFEHQMLSIELSESQTSALVTRCREEGVTVTSALAAAFAGAQLIIQGDETYYPNIAVAADLRDRLPDLPGEAMGLFAGGVALKFTYSGKKPFWDNARAFHKKIRPLYTNKSVFNDPLTWCTLAPGILDSFHYKIFGHLVSPQSKRADKLSAFSKREDVVASILKRENMDSLDKKMIGTAVTNLTRLDFPREYGALQLDRLIINPGGAFPLANVNLVLGVVTCAGKLSLLAEFVEENVDIPTMERIKDQALEFLACE